MSTKPTERFSDRVSDYLAYRPEYPQALLSKLRSACGLDAYSAIADIGSGTGKLTKLLLLDDYQVFAVEPNREMREAAQALLGDKSNFVSLPGDAATTGLQSNSIDLVVAAQAFHWFDPEPTKREFLRILKPRGRIALIWNERNTSTAFQREYDTLLSQHCPDYLNTNHRNVSDTELQAFFAPYSYEHWSTTFCQTFGLTGFLGRMFSSSYTPQIDTAEAKNLRQLAVPLFERHATNGVIEFSYQCRLYLSEPHTL